MTIAATTMDCPACGVSTRTGSSFIAFCSACGHRWLNRSEQDHAVAEAAIFTHDYAGYRQDATYVRSVTAIIRDKLASRVPPPARLLDIGCGAGDFMAAAKGLGYSVEGIDISEASAEICRERGLQCIAGDLLEHDFPEKFDVIVMWDVVAHLRDPASFVARARDLLTNRGILFVKTPIFGDLSVAISSRLPRAAGILLGAPSHTQYFDRESLAALLNRTAFEPEWIDAGSARSPGGGGSFKRRLARRLRAVIGGLSGDSSVYLAAHAKR